MNNTIKASTTENAPITLSDEIFSVVLHCAVRASEDPIKTIGTFKLLSKHWSDVTTNLFHRDSTVQALIVKQMQDLKLFVSVKSFTAENPSSRYYKNIFPIIWISNIVKTQNACLQEATQRTNKDEEKEKLKQQMVVLPFLDKISLSEFERILNERKKKLLQVNTKQGICANNECTAIINSIFETHYISNQITFAEFLPFFNLAFNGNNYSSTKSDSFALEILLYIMTFITKRDVNALVGKIESQIDKFKGNFLDNRALDDATISRKVTKLSRLIIRFGNFVADYFVTDQKNQNEYKKSYCRLIEKFFPMLHWQNNLLPRYFIRMAVTYIKFLLHESTAMPTFIFHLIFEMKKFENEYNSISEIIEKIMQLDYFNVTNIFNNVKYSDMRIYFLKNIDKNNESTTIDNLNTLLTSLGNDSNKCFLNNTKDYIEIIEKIFFKIKDSTKGDVIEKIEKFFQSYPLASNCLDVNSPFYSDYKLVTEGFIKYLKSTE